MIQQQTMIELWREIKDIKVGEENNICVVEVSDCGGYCINCDDYATDVSTHYVYDSLDELKNVLLAKCIECGGIL